MPRRLATDRFVPVFPLVGAAASVSRSLAHREQRQVPWAVLR